jgi:DNA-directed RNA polymerase specialized sigma24 family protein
LVPVPTPSHDTCWTILRAASTGETAARSTFARSYEPTIRGFLETRWRGRVLATETSDATQEVFVECLKPGGVLERADASHGDFRALLGAVTRNVARRFEERAIERGRVRPEDSAWLQQVASDENGQATVFDRSWAHALVEEASDRYRELANGDGDAGRRRIELLERRFGSDEAIREIAAAWNVPAQHVHNEYKKARKEFYRCLREVVAFHRPAATDLDGECRELLAMLG